MSINFKIENKKDHLLVTSSGKDGGLQEVINYNKAIIDSATKYDLNKILCDERNLTYAISLGETYKLADFASKYASEVAAVAIICDKEQIEEAKFYETVANNRGLNIFATSDMNEAKKWLEID